MEILKKIVAPAAIVGVMGMASAASAQGFLSEDSWTIKGFGGASFGQENTGKFKGLDDGSGGTFEESGKVKLDTGYTLGAGVGYLFGDTWGLGLEYAYRNSDIKSVGNDLGDGGTARSNAFMFNGTYAFDNGGQWVPYLGAGLGIADVELKIKGGDADGKYDKSGMLAGQIFAGVGYELSPQTALYGELRYFATEEKKLGGKDGSSVKYGYSSVDALVGVAYRF